MKRLLAWRKLNRQILECARCDLKGQPRVLGFGKKYRVVMIIGESPGNEEIRKGRPFVGRSGKFLRSVMDAARLKPGQCYMTNAVKCLPKGRITADEIRKCQFWLDQELKLVTPKKILTLGMVAAKATYGKKAVRLPHPSMVIRGFMAIREFGERFLREVR